MSDGIVHTGVDPQERVHPGHGQQYRSCTRLSKLQTAAANPTNAAAELEGIDESVGR